MTTQFERTGNPFPGLRPFETDEYNLFFGREGQSDELLARLGRTRFLAVVGTSGSGKSSLIRAGLMPAVYGGLMPGAGSAWRIAVMRPGHDPVGNLAEALSSDDVLGSPEMDDDVETTIIETTLRRSTLGLADAVRQARLEADENVLVVVDQFEELFRFRAVRAQESGTEDDAAAFVKLLLEAARQREAPVFVVLTMRSDFLGDCSQFQGLPEAINEGQYLIPRMTRDERRSAITGPAAVGGAEMSPPLVNRLLNDVGDNPDQLPILQHALMRTWEHWRAGSHDGRAVGLGDYEAVGTMADALSRHADEAYNELGGQGREQSTRQRTAELVFKALTERGADNRETRRPTRFGELCEVTVASEEEVASVVEVFRREGRSFLMPPEGTPLTHDTVIDISHESLIRNWQRLKDWVKDEADGARIYRRLAEAAAAHRAGEGGLLDEVTLGWVDRWRGRYTPNRAWGVRYHPAYDDAMAFLEESRAANETRLASERERDERELERTRAFAEQQARAARRLRMLSYGMGLALLLALLTAGWALTLQRSAVAAQVSAVSAQRAAEVERERARAAEQSAVEQKREVEDERNRALEAEDRARDAKESADDARRHAEVEKARADEEAARSKKLAAKERAAKESLAAALKKAEDIKVASQFFRNALADFDRAELITEFKDAYSQIEEAVGKFDAVEDYGGEAAAYLKLGVAQEKVKFEGSSRKVELWEKAVENYRRIGSHMEAGETLEGIGDDMLAQALEARPSNYINAAGGAPAPAHPDALTTPAETGAQRSEIEEFEENALKIPEQARVDIAARYEAAYGEYVQEASGYQPSERPKALLGDMVSVLNKKGVLYDSLDGDAYRLKAIESYKESLRLEKEAGEKDDRFPVNGRLLRLYYELGDRKLVDSFTQLLREAASKKGDDEGEVLLGIATLLGDRPEAQEYAEWARRLFYHYKSAHEYVVPWRMGDAIKEIEAVKLRRGKPLSESNYQLALEYFKSALALTPKDQQINLWADVGELHALTGHTKEAAEAYGNAVELAKQYLGTGGAQSETTQLKLELYRKFAAAQEAANQSSQAAETYKQYLALLDETGAEFGKCETARVRRIIATSGVEGTHP
jgi:energy-coupling factor transporter ATP-binding protein EcfA2